MFGFNHFYNDPVPFLLLLVNAIYFFVNVFKFANANKAGNLPRKAYYNQLYRGNLCFTLSGMSAITMGESSPGFGLWFLAGLWYICTPWMMRKRAKKASEAAMAANAQVAAAGQNAADANVWPPPPQV